MVHAVHYRAHEHLMVRHILQFFGRYLGQLLLVVLPHLLFHRGTGRYRALAVGFLQDGVAVAAMRFARGIHHTATRPAFALHHGAVQRNRQGCPLYVDGAGKPRRINDTHRELAIRAGVMGFVVQCRTAAGAKQLALATGVLFEIGPVHLVHKAFFGQVEHKGLEITMALRALPLLGAAKAAQVENLVQWGLADGAGQLRGKHGA